LKKGISAYHMIQKTRGNAQITFHEKWRLFQIIFIIAKLLGIVNSSNDWNL